MEAAPLFHSPLTDYLAERGIPYGIAFRYCCQLNYGVRGKRYFAVGFPNVAGGYEIRSRFFKGCVPPKDVSLVKAKGFADCLCFLQSGRADLTVMTSGDALTAAQVAQIRDIVLSKSEVTAQNITVVEVK